MIVIPARRLVILLPWKAASQTLRARLADHDTSRFGPFFHFNAALNAVVHQHLTLAPYLALPEAGMGYRLAVFVRNPYDRVYSGFLQLQRDIQTQPDAAFPAPWIRNLVLHQLALHRQAIARAQGRVDDWFRDLPIAKVMSAGLDSSLPLHPCHYWTHAGNRQRAQFIGRVENFEADFAALCAEFDLDVSVNRSDVATRLPDPDGYVHAARLAPETIRKINSLFQGDFQHLGYRMLDPGPPPAMAPAAGRNG